MWFVPGVVVVVVNYLNNVLSVYSIFTCDLYLLLPKYLHLSSSSLEEISDRRSFVTAWD